MRVLLKSGERYTVGVVGLGKLGLPMAALLSYAGHEVIGYDLSLSTVEAVSSGECPIVEPRVQELMDKNPFFATSNIEDLRVSDVVIIIVPTPSDGHGWFENKYVENVLSELAEVFEDTTGKTIVVASTVMPGSMDGPLREALESTGLVAGETVNFLYSPEFIALGSVIHDMQHPDIVIIGSVNGSDTAPYQRVLIPTHAPEQPVAKDPHERYPTPVLHELTAVEAEIAKISINTYVTMKISFANVLGEVCENFGARSNLVVGAVGGDSRIGTKYLNPGAAYGGPCFPRDTEAYNALCSRLKVHNGLPNATRDVNLAQARRLAKQVALRPKVKTVAVLGIAYKPGTPITEESAGLAVAIHLGLAGYKIILTDPYAKKPDEHAFMWMDDPQSAIDAADCVLLMCPHEEYRSLKYPDDVIDPWNKVGSLGKTW